MSTSKTCLLCSKKPRTRGLCQNHYSQFQRQLEKIPANMRADFDAESVKAGLILPAKSESNPFATIAKQIQERASEYTVEEAAKALDSKKPARKKKQAP